ncbi:MAG: AzlC family ABC transporter permease [Lachnospiraceae bacterium]|nr:AzlC family ABC transporter permease [Lachnospiraceae bacterium]MBQ1399724.1 AzlC family ABC transporter permease [Lachnospiraceae bacterium]MBQ1414342.1 AzlC family ABC transporter permease [Lachnospiraceae bacterium]MBQ1515793.1 AzlC family ABC transporter permease [Lachnospiraceae bacterium]MBQ3400651.1 AzlC family ABC transporter permease [Lachnospiraceae bacterium]
MTSKTFRIWKRGFRDGVPVLLGYFAVSFAFGIQAAGLGITALEATILSLVNLTSAGQFGALSIIASGGSCLTLALQQLVINLRYSLMSASLSQNVDPKLSTAKRMGIAYGFTDEIFALSSMYPKPLPPVYTVGLMSAAVPGWTFGTLLGAALGQVLPGRVTSALGLAIYGMFIAIIMPGIREKRSVRFAVLAAMGAMILLNYCPGLNLVPANFRLIIVTVIVAFAAAVIAPVPDEDEEAGAEAGDAAAGGPGGPEAAEGGEEAAG